MRYKDNTFWVGTKFLRCKTIQTALPKEKITNENRRDDTSQIG